jgi:hypothetical protein
MARPIADDVAAKANGTPSWYRTLRSDGTSAVFDGTVGTADCDLTLATAAIVAGAVISVVSFSYSQSKDGS